MDDYHQRKEERRQRYAAKHGVKMVVCTACSGSGYYDSWNSPRCGCCDGRGKHFPDPVSVPPPAEQITRRKGR